MATSLEERVTQLEAQCELLNKKCDAMLAALLEQMQTTIILQDALDDMIVADPSSPPASPIPVS